VTSTGALPQSITLNLGKSYDNIDMLEYLPQRHTGRPPGHHLVQSLREQGQCDLHSVASGTWPADATYHAFSPAAGTVSRAERAIRAPEADAVMAAEPARSPAKLRSAPPARREQQARRQRRTGGNSGTGARRCAGAGAVGVLAVPLAAGFQWRSGGSATTGAGGRGGSVTTSSPTAARVVHGRSRCKRDQHH